MYQNCHTVTIQNSSKLTFIWIDKYEGIDTIENYKHIEKKTIESEEFILCYYIDIKLNHSNMKCSVRRQYSGYTWDLGVEWKLDDSFRAALGASNNLLKLDGVYGHAYSGMLSWKNSSICKSMICILSFIYEVLWLQVYKNKNLGKTAFLTKSKFIVLSFGNSAQILK